MNKQLSNCITDDIAICINDDNIQIMFLMIFLILTVLLIFIKTQIM